MRALSLCTCCRHYHGAAAGCIPRSSHPAVSAFPGRGRRVGLHIVLFEACSAFRGRDGHCWPPPAQIRTCPIKASGSYLGCLTSKRMAAFRTRPSAWVTRSRPCVRSVLCCSAFPLVPGLGSTNSATGRPALFVGFTATMPESDFSGSCISGYGSSPSRRGPGCSVSIWPTERAPGSRTRSFCTCQGLRPRRNDWALAISHPFVLPSAQLTASALGKTFFRGSMAGLCAPLPTLRRHPRGRLRTARGRCGSLFLHRRGLTWAFSGQGVRFIGISKTPVAVSVSKV